MTSTKASRSCGSRGVAGESEVQLCTFNGQPHLSGQKPAGELSDQQGPVLPVGSRAKRERAAYGKMQWKMTGHAAVYGTGANDWHRGQAFRWHQGMRCRVSVAVKLRQGLVEAGMLSGGLLLALDALLKKEPTKESMGRHDRLSVLAAAAWSLNSCGPAAVSRPQLEVCACLTCRLRRVPLPPCAAATHCWCR